MECINNIKTKEELRRYLKEYQYIKCKGLLYFINAAGRVTVQAESKGIVRAKVLDGTEIIADFECCTYLAEVTIPSSVRVIERRAFAGCTNLQKLHIPVTDGVLEISASAFENCTGLKSVSLPKVKAIGKRAFCNCKSLFNFKMQSCLEIGEAAFAYSGLKKINLPKGVLAIGNDAFRYCVNLKWVILPDTVCTMGDRVFCACRNLTDVTMPRKFQGRIVKFFDAGTSIRWQLT